MKIPRLYTLIALITLGACQMNEVIHSPLSQEGLYAQMEAIASTKTYIDDGNAVVWAEGDQIAVFRSSLLVMPEKDLDSSVRFSLWDGGTPATSTLTQDPSANDTYIIDEAAAR